MRAEPVVPFALIEYDLQGSESHRQKSQPDVVILIRTSASFRRFINGGSEMSRDVSSRDSMPIGTLM